MTYKITPQMWAEIKARVDECDQPPDEPPFEPLDTETELRINDMMIQTQGEALREASEKVIELRDKNVSLLNKWQDATGSAKCWCLRFYLLLALNVLIVVYATCSIPWGR